MLTEMAIDVRDLNVERGHRPVLKGLTFSIPRGTVVGLLGPSGSGKTTVMRCIVGIQRVLSGEVTVLGRPAGSAELRSRVGYMTQAPSVYPDLTARENARYFAEVHGLALADADRVIAEVGLAGAAAQLVGTLSGGQRARASLACTLLGQPDVLVLDEPTVGQDPVLRNELWQRFRAQANAGATIIVSSHVMDEARRCDRLLLISEGRIIADDTPEGVLASANATDMDDAFLALVTSQRSEARA